MHETTANPPWAAALVQLVHTSAIPDDPAHLGWLWANAIALADAGMENLSAGRAADPARYGALFGLHAARVLTQPSWVWQTVNPGDALDLAPVAKLYPKPCFTAASISQILETRSPHIRMEGRNAVFQLLCSVEEGIGCRFLSARWRDTPLPRQLSEAIIDGLGWTLVEHAVRRQTVVRCTLPPSGPALCELDRGTGFQRLEEWTAR
jgi:hypothetical protein